MRLPAATCLVVSTLLVLNGVSAVSDARSSPRKVPLVEASVEIVGFGSLEAPARVEFRLEDPADPHQPPVSRLVTLPSVERFLLPAHSKWRLSLAPGRYWAPAQSMVVRDTPISVRWTVAPAGAIEGSLATPRGEPLPETITLTLLASNSGRLPPEFEGAQVVCPVREDHWVCRVPAGFLDLRLRAPRFLSAYRWGVRTNSGTATDIGLLQLRHGASLTGWVLAADGRPLGSSCRVDLDVPGMEPDASSRKAKRALRTLTTTVLSNGFFEFEGIATGTYAITARAPGYAAATLYPVTVEKDTESAIRDPIMLDRPVDMTVSVEPAQDFEGRPWSVLLRRKNPSDNRVSEIHAAPLSSPGVFRGDRLSPGSYQVIVRDADHQQVASDNFLLSADSDTLNLQVQLLEVQGTVRLGEQPLPGATVELENRTGALAVTFHSDDDGEFAGQLPGGQEWRALVTAESPHVVSALGKVDVVESATEAQIAIRLPDNGVRGSVVDSTGRGVPATVDYYNLAGGGHSSLNTDASGTFQLRGLPKGEYVFSATAAATGAASEAAHVAFTETDQSATIRLTVSDTTSVRGIVSDSAGPVPRTELLALPKYADGSFNILGGTQATAGVDGAFELAIPTAATVLDLIMMARGRILDTASVTLPTQTPLLLRLPDSSGTTRIAWHDPLNPFDTVTAKPLLLLRGVILDMGLLARWAREEGRAIKAPTTEIEIPNMAPGAYRACFPRHGQTMAQWIAQRRRSCVDGNLSAGGTLELREPQDEPAVE